MRDRSICLSRGVRGSPTSFLLPRRRWAAEARSFAANGTPPRSRPLRQKRAPRKAPFGGWRISKAYLPDGPCWTGYTPVEGALHSPPDWLKPMDPGAETVITFDGGFEIRSAAFAQGEPPLIRIEGMPLNCHVFIDEFSAGEMACQDGSWSAPGWDAPGQHLVDIVPGRSLTYHIMPDPALREGWEPWTARTLR